MASGDADLERSRAALDKVLAAGASIGAAAVASVAQKLPSHLQVPLAANVALTGLGFWSTLSAVESLGPMFVRANLKGVDLNKRTTKRDAAGILVRPIEGIAIPESQGTVTATVFILVMSAFIPFVVAVHDVADFPHAHLAEYLAVLCTIAFAVLMGFADDVLDLRWRQKIFLPFLAALPVLCVYYANGNEAGVMVPNVLRPWLGDSLHLGMLFYVFLLVLSVFSTHSINIYAGVNGLEAGQSVVIAASLFLFNIVQLHRVPARWHEYRDHQLRSLFLIMPLLAVSCALLRLNWFPARVFVGDTYCYFAGMSFAAISITAHCSKTVVLLLLPQCLNFLYSLPQLAHRRTGIPCPRHRMPDYDPSLGWVKNSYAEVVPAELPRLGSAIFWVLRTFRLAHIVPSEDGRSVRMSNLTLINFVLYTLGSCREDVLCLRLLALQGLSSLFCFAIRFGVASCLFDVVV